jgi:DNA-binding transcriptional MerR regulator
MKINEVEAQVGITKKNIRFYEEEGLLTPRRNRENGYRDYGEAELRTLRQIKLLRKLGLPLEEIRRLQAGVLTVSDAMNGRRKTWLIPRR